MTVFLVSFLAVLALRYGLQILNLRHLRARGGEVPAELRGVVDEPTLQRISAYTFDKSRLEMVESAVQWLLVLVFLFGGWLGAYDAATSLRPATLADPWHLGAHPVTRGLLFFLPLVIAELLLAMPFSSYENFVLERRHGFNRMTGKLWLADGLKTLALTLLLVAAAIAASLRLVAALPVWWWLAVWGFFLVLGIFLMYVSPYVIEPLFFKFQPLQVPGLEEGIRALLGRAGLHVSRVQQVDASRRSQHSNAYFTGIGRVKRIVLFDTLLQRMQPPEILAVLAHEAGHWKRRHVFKRLVQTEAVALVLMFAASRLLRWPGLPGLVGLEGASFCARAVIVACLGSIAAFPFTPLLSWLSRRDEWQADRFAVQLTGNPADLEAALAKLSRDNLSNLHPQPLYAAFYYSHPPIVQRLRRLRPPAGLQAGHAA